LNESLPLSASANECSNIAAFGECEYLGDGSRKTKLRSCVWRAKLSAALVKTKKAT